MEITFTHKPEDTKTLHKLLSSKFSPIVLLVLIVVSPLLLSSILPAVLDFWRGIFILWGVAAGAAVLLAVLVMLTRTPNERTEHPFRVTYRFDEENWVVLCDSIRTANDWAKIKKIKRVGDYMVINLHEGTCHAIPLTAFESLRQADALFEFVEKSRKQATPPPRDQAFPRWEGTEYDLEIKDVEAIRLRYTLTPKDKRVAAKRPTTCSRKVLHLFYFPLLCVSFLRFDQLVASLACIALGVASLEFVWQVVSFRWWNKYRAATAAQTVEHRCVVISPRGLSFGSGEGDGWVSWAMAQLHESTEYLRFDVGAIVPSGILIPKRAFASEAEALSFADRAREFIDEYNNDEDNDDEWVDPLGLDE